MLLSHSPSKRTCGYLCFYLIIYRFFSYFRYDFIGKFEHIREDSNAVLALIGAPKYLQYPPSRPSNTSSQIDYFMSQIPEELRYHLQQVYKQDQEIFGYEKRVF